LKLIVKYILLLIAFTLVFSAIVIIAGSYPLNTSQNTEACLSCHEDRDLTTEKDGKKISLYVNPEHYKNSVHSVAECSDCHENYNPDEIPHTKTKKEVACLNCHKGSGNITESVHAKTKCYDCHSKHEVMRAKEFSKNGSKNCLSCHKTKNIQSYAESVHGKKNVGCNGCHGSGHNVVKISKSQVADVCGKCHGINEKNFMNSIHLTALKSGNKDAPTCIDCHGSHKIIKAKVSVETESCLRCHLDEKKFPGESTGSAKFVKRYKTSVHATIEKDGIEAAGCSDCHGNHMIQQPSNPQASTTRTRLPETCGKCHADVVKSFLNSAHGKSLMEKNVAAPTCVSCHSEHSIELVEKSPEFSKLKQVDMCLGCHVEGKLPHKNYKGEEVLITNYKDSQHYKALLKGNNNAATCSDCHGSHEMNKFNEPSSKIYKSNIAQTCGQVNCHVKQLSEFTNSIHDVSIKTKENSDSPTCTGCHGNHQILKKDESPNRIASSKGLVQLCSDCHNSVELVKKYDLPVGRTQSYLDSYHGLAVRGGSKIAANCESCHGNHNIRPSTDALSTIHKDNLPKTCGNCHPGATEIFFNTPIHITNASKESPVLYWITRFYIILIVLVIGGMAAHNFFDFYKKFRARK
jgi:predicted CXXCH cytochrome family protein